MKLNYYNNAWPLSDDRCRCDSHFVQYLAERQVRDKAIFHFGTGEHHLVGTDNHARGNPNQIMAVTASRAEYHRYIDFVIDNPEAANHYKVWFCDIYTLSRRTTPRFDIVTLFHLCESLPSAAARLNDIRVLELFLGRLNPGGTILFFTKSEGYDHGGVGAGEMVRDFVSRKRMIVDEEYETLLVCRRSW